MEKLSHTKSLSITIIIPTLNEENRLENTLKIINKFIKQRIEIFQIFIIDENSTDNTKGIFEKFCKEENTENFFFFSNSSLNYGKGASQRFVLNKVKTDFFLLFDADSAVDITYLDKFIEFIDFDMISGIRLNHPKSNLWYRHVIGLMNNLLLHLFLYREVVPDSTCGFKLIKTSTYNKIKDKLFINTGFFDVELIFLFIKKNYKIKFIPVDWNNSPESRINVIKSIFIDFINIFRIKYRHTK